MARAALKKPTGWKREPVPPLPIVDETDAERASTTYSHYRTGLSNHRTDLSEHRTELSEYRTGLSDERTDMSKRRTGLSFQRTRLSADRTLMSVIRTSLSLISFGFTIYQVFEKLRTGHVIDSGEAPRTFGMSLIVLGVAMMVLGIVYHLQFMLALRGERRRMVQEEMLYGESPFPPSMTLITALLLLLLGLAAILSIAFRIAPFG